MLAAMAFTAFSTGMLPLSDRNFKRLLIFVASWRFAVNLATPFFTVFIVRQLGFDASFIMALSVVSQVANFLHLAMGASVAGVTLAVTNIALKLPPRQRDRLYRGECHRHRDRSRHCADPGRLLADFFAQRRLQLLVRWSSPQSSFNVPILLTSWDFYFLLAGPIGMCAIHRLSLVEEQGEIEPREMMTEILNSTRRSIRNISTVAGVRAATFVPVSLPRDCRVAPCALRAAKREVKLDDGSV